MFVRVYVCDVVTWCWCGLLVLVLLNYIDIETNNNNQRLTGEAWVLSFCDYGKYFCSIFDHSPKI